MEKKKQATFVDNMISYTENLKRSIKMLTVSGYKVYTEKPTISIHHQWMLKMKLRRQCHLK